MAKSTRTTISVPQDLKDRMAAVGEDVNWSAVACRAFEQKLGEFAEKKASKSMNDVIQRLRASAYRKEEVDYRTGFEAGKTWASDSAEAAELERLDEFWQAADSRHEWADFFRDDEVSSAYGCDERLFFVIDPACDGDRGSAREFWDQYCDTEQDATEGFVRGFAEGALEIWDRVKNEI